MSGFVIEETDEGSSLILVESKFLFQVLEDDVPPPRIILADSFYGRSASFRAAIRAHGIHYGVGVRKELKVRRLDKNGIRRGPETSADSVARKVKFRRLVCRCSRL